MSPSVSYMTTHYDTAGDVSTQSVRHAVGVVGERLRAARERAGMDQIDVAVGIGFSAHTAVSNIERGRSAIHVNRVAPAARLLRVSADYLLGLTDDPTPAAELSRRLAAATKH